MYCLFNRGNLYSGTESSVENGPHRIDSSTRIDPRTCSDPPTLILRLHSLTILILECTREECKLLSSRSVESAFASAIPMKENRERVRVGVRIAYRWEEEEKQEMRGCHGYPSSLFAERVRRQTMEYIEPGVHIRFQYRQRALSMPLPIRPLDVGPTRTQTRENDRVRWRRVIYKIRSSCMGWRSKFRTITCRINGISKL